MKKKLINLFIIFIIFITQHQANAVDFFNIKKNNQEKYLQIMKSNIDIGKKNKNTWYPVEFNLKYKKNLLNAQIIQLYNSDEFYNYMKQVDLYKKISNLKKGMDKLSIDYINHFIELRPYYNCYSTDLYIKYDQKLQQQINEFNETFQQPTPIIFISPIYYYNIYGLKDLPPKIFEYINGKIIIDGGGLCGDTALVFHHYFPDSPIHVYEPVEDLIREMKYLLENTNTNGKIIPIKKGLGGYNDFITFNTIHNGPTTAEITTIDSMYKNEKQKIGLIKLAIEGYETDAIRGSYEIIKRDKPVIISSISHNPIEFFELKGRIEKLNLGYKFCIRRIEFLEVHSRLNGGPNGGLVLIAYPKKTKN